MNSVISEMNQIIDSEYVVINRLLNSADLVDDIDEALSTRLRGCIAEMEELVDMSREVINNYIDCNSEYIMRNEIEKISSGVNSILKLVDNGVIRELSRSKVNKSKDRKGPNNHLYKHIDEQELLRMSDSGVGMVDIAKHFDVSLPTVYSRLRKLKG